MSQNIYPRQLPLVTQRYSLEHKEGYTETRNTLLNN